MAGLRPNIYAAICITLFVAVLALVLRLKARSMTKMRLWFDDYLAMSALVFAAGYCAINLLWLSRYKLAQYLTDLDQAAADRIRFASRILLWSSELCYACSIASAKLAILTFYWRVFRYTSIRIAIQVLLVTATIWITIRTFMVIFHCVPVQAYWDKTIKGARCPINESKFFFGTVLTHCLMDAIILILPIIEVMKMHLRFSQKLAVIGLFTSGTIVCVASVFVLVESIKYDPSTAEISHDIAVNNMWASVEVNMAVFAACLPMLRPIFRKLIPQLATDETSHAISRPSVVISLPGRRKMHSNEHNERRLTDLEHGIFTTLPSARSHTSGVGNDSSRAINSDG